MGEWLTRPQFARDQELTRQLNAARLSVMLNISEGFVRRRDAEMRQFLRYAQASNAELRGCLYANHGRGYFGDLEAEQAIENCKGVGRMLTRFMATLKDQEPRTKDGPRTKNEPRTKH